MQLQLLLHSSGMTAGTRCPVGSYCDPTMGAVSCNVLNYDGVVCTGAVSKCPAELICIQPEEPACDVAWCDDGFCCEDLLHPFPVNVNCPAGSHCPIPCLVLDCPAGYFCPPNTSDYTLHLCSAGHYCLARSSEEHLCEAVFMCPDEGMSSAIACSCSYFCTHLG